MKKFCLTICIVFILSTAGFSRAQDYIIGAGDVLEVTVYDHADLTQTVRVNSDGTIMLAMLGMVKVGDLSVSDASGKVAGLYGDGWLVEPQVNIFIQEFRSGKATILGQIAKPGLYELSNQITLLELISTAGGLTEDAGSLATIKRRTVSKDQESVITVDLKQLIEKGDTSLNLTIQPGDNIYIQKAKIVYVSGEIKKPGAYKCTDETSIIQLITLAGGFTDKASPTRVKLIRKQDGKETVFEKVNMDFLVDADDIIVVPESFF